jgi:2-oxoglutarate ferredoxin oxidoreductase subunit gamma
MERYELILAGLGGQGLLLAGLIIGDAAAIGEGKFAAQIEAYAPLARGAESKSELIISTEEIDYPKVQKADILVALSQDAYDNNMGRLKDDGFALVDSSSVKTPVNEKTKALPMTDIAIQSTGKPFTVSIVALGALARLTSIVELNSLLTSINFRAPNGTEEINKKAAEAGYMAAGEIA